jgi:hypothetical protein
MPRRAFAGERHRCLSPAITLIRLSMSDALAHAARSPAVDAINIFVAGAVEE